MGKSISIDQSHAIIAALATNVDWGRLNGNLLQEQILKNPKEAGEHFNRFLENGARMLLVGDFKIATKPFDISFISKNWKIVLKEEDKRSVELTEVDFSKVKFISCLKEKESSIKGEEKLHRFKQTKDIRLGATVFMGLWEDYQANSKNSVLERLYQAGTIKGYLDFFGTVFLNPNGNRSVLYFARVGDGSWGWGVDWLECDWGIWNLSAVLSQV